MNPEQIDLSKKCVMVALFLGLYYNRKDIITNYSLSNVSDFIILILKGNDKYPSLFEKLSNKYSDIDNVWKETFDLYLEMENHFKKEKLEKPKILEIYKNSNRRDMVDKVKSFIESGSASFELVVYVGMYFNIHFEILENGKKHYLTQLWNKSLIPSPDNVIVLHCCDNHIYYSSDVEGIEKSIKRQIEIKQENEELLNFLYESSSDNFLDEAIKDFFNDI